MFVHGYSALDDSWGTPRLIPVRMRRCRRWVVGASGVSVTEEGEDRDLKSRLRQLNYLWWSPDKPVPSDGLGSFHPMFDSGSADAAVDDVLRFLEGAYTVAAGEVVCAIVHPLDGAGRLVYTERLCVFPEAGGVPTAVSYANLNENRLSRGVEFRVESGRADEYLPLAEAVEVMSTRFWGRREGFLQAAVVPLRPDDAPHVLAGEIHADFRHEPGGGVRVCPMDWNGLGDRPDDEAAVEAAAAQVRGWIKQRRRLLPEYAPPRAVGRLYRFDDGGCGLWAHPLKMRAVFEDGLCMVWNDPFELVRGTAV